MANIASVAYAIEGPKETLEKILGAICLAIASEETFYEEYLACKNLGYTKEELECKRLGGEIEDEPTFDNGILRFYAEERWGLQDFEELLRQKFPDIKIYWTVEECGCEVYCTNDKEGKYFKDRFYVDVCIDETYYSEYFQYESSVFKWLNDLTNGKVNTKEKLQAFNNNHEDDDNYISIHEFSVTS